MIKYLIQMHLWQSTHILEAKFATLEAALQAKEKVDRAMAIAGPIEAMAHLSADQPAWKTERDAADIVRIVDEGGASFSLRPALLSHVVFFEIEALDAARQSVKNEMSG